MTETFVQHRADRVSFTERGIPYGREITLTQLIDHNFPTFAATVKKKIYGVIKLFNKLPSKLLESIRTQKLIMVTTLPLYLFTLYQRTTSTVE